MQFCINYNHMFDFSPNFSVTKQKTWFILIFDLSINPIRFNISDKVLVSLEILLEWRQLFRRGVPISIAIKSKLEAMVERVEVNIVYFVNRANCF